MARPVTMLVVFFLAFNLFSGMLIATGVDSMLGIDAQVGEDDEYEDLNSSTQEVSSGSPTGNTLFGMYNVLSDQLGSFFDSVLPGLAMLNRAGVPGYLTNQLLKPLFSLAMAIGVISFLRGWNL